MYRVVVKISGHVYKREFDVLNDAKKFYAAMKKNNKNVWLLDLTSTPKDDKVSTVKKVLAFLDKVSGH